MKPTTATPTPEIVPALDQQLDFEQTSTEELATTRQELLQTAFRNQLELLVSLEPGRWSERMTRARGEISFESTFGGSGLVIEAGNNGITPVLNLLHRGETQSIYFNKATVEDLVADTVRVRRGHFEASLNNPVVVIQGQLPEELLSPGIVLGPSPFTRRMLFDSDVNSQFEYPRKPTPMLTLSHIERIALVAPTAVFTDSGLNQSESQWARRYIDLIDQLSHNGIVADTGSPGSLFCQELRRKIAS